jgi:flagellar hook-basal body complex protein FliE
MSLIDSISGLGGGFFGGTRAATGATDANVISSSGSTGKAQSMDTLLKNLSPENVQAASDTQTANLLSGATSSTDATSTGRSIFADTATSASSATSGQDSFVSTLNGFINDVNAKSQVAEQANQDILTGKSDNIHQAMISMQEASISFDLLVQVRNKLVDAYKELSKISV